MQVEQLVWDRKTLHKISKKHYLTPGEVEEVFESTYHIRRSGRVHHAYGQTGAGRYVFVVLFHLGKGRAQVVTARDMAQKERQLYLGTLRR